MVCGIVKISVNAESLLSFILSFLGKGFRYLARLGKSGTDVLTDEANRLKAIWTDIEKAVSAREIIQFRKRNQQVEQWLKEVEDLLDEVDKFKASCLYRIPRFKDCPCWATDMLLRIQKLKTEGGDLQKELLGEDPLPRNNEVPDPQIVGGEETLSTVRGLLGNSDVKIIGIYGMPGIGKTTLLQKIYHELVRCPNQQGGGDPAVRVIYARVSKEPNILSLQKAIAQELGLTLAEDGPSDSSSRESQQARTLFRALSNSNATLLLDDVWEPLRWDKVGIPSPDVDQGPCKIVFTTPFQQVCKDMGAGAATVKVGFLSDDQSWSLFCQKVKKPEDDPSIAPARAVINKCGGLPRAVITVSNHMACCSAPNRACGGMVEKLKHSPHEISGMKDKVLSPLKCILDKLEEKSIHQMEERAMGLRQCLLYCSLFPEDQNIYIDQLIDYWVGEGFLDAKCYLTLPAARDRGREIIRNLMDECFLESTTTTTTTTTHVDDDDHMEVRLHDMVRGMALWLTDGESEQSRLFLTSTRLKESTNRRWEMAERISSMDNGVKVFPSSIIRCPHLLTFLFNNYSIHRRHNPSILQQQHGRMEGKASSMHHDFLSDVQGEPRNLFKFAQALRVLDLSGTKIEKLPAEIGSIDELQYLNVSYTNIRSLPKELNRLRKLRQLKLRGTPRLSNIPGNSIPSETTILQMFDLFNSGYSWRPSKGINLLGGQINLSNLSTWTFLNEIGLTITSLPSLQRLCSYDKLSSSTVFLNLQEVEGLSQDHLSSIFKTMGNLRELSVSFSRVSSANIMNLEISTSQLRKLEVLELCNLISLSTIAEVIDGGGTRGLFLKNLRQLHISNCPGLTHITWIHRLPSLVEIALSHCQGVEEVLTAKQLVGNCCSLSRLRKLHLESLPNLTRIACCPLSSPSLEIILVTGCPLFKGLSLDAQTASSVKKIGGERGWWDRLQWDENDDTKRILQARFTDTSPR